MRLIGMATAFLVCWCLVYVEPNPNQMAPTLLEAAFAAAIAVAFWIGLYFVFKREAQ
jgi:hypothetical protein